MTIPESTIALLRRLTHAHGVTGSEDAVRKLFREHVTGDILTDKLGSIYVCREGAAAKPRIMLSAHLDEVGFVVQSITADGYIKFVSLGRVLENTLLAQRMRILTDDEREVIGVVASKPIHFATAADMAKITPIAEMVIDVGARNSEEARSKYGIRIGQPITFASDFAQMSDSDIYVAKAFDNRVGVGLVIETAEALLGHAHPNTVYCGANSQEEIQGRGARTAAALLNPDVGIVLEGVPADDFPGASKDAQQGALGKGVQVRIMDGSAIMNRRLNQFIIDIAEELRIPYQVVVRPSGGTDASLINVHDVGVPVTVLGIPVRYTHTAHSLIDINDYLHGQQLLLEIVKRLDAAVYDRLVAY